MKTIVVGADGSADSRRAVEWAAELAGETGARVVAVHAVGLLEHERGDPAGSHLLPQFNEWTAALDRLDASQVERRLVAGEPVDALWATAADSAADLVVVGSRGAGAHGAMRLGSTSLRLAEGSACPVVIVPVTSAAARP
jgi:nucleotide-binding universal stress UspA family protein